MTDEEIYKRYDDEVAFGNLSFNTESIAHVLARVQLAEKRIAALELILEQEKQQLTEWDVMLEQEKADFFNLLGGRDHG